MGFAISTMSLARKAARAAFGEPVVYLPAAGGEVGMVGIFHREMLALDMQLDGGRVATVRETMRITEEDLGAVVPGTSDRLRFSGRVYEVTDIESGPRGTVVCVLGRSVAT